MCVLLYVCVCVFLLFSSAVGMARCASDKVDMLFELYYNTYCLVSLIYPLVFPRTSRFASFPEYLVVQIKKFTFGLDWVPKKFGRYLLHAFA